MFDSFSDKYELMITFPQRIDKERPFFKKIFDEYNSSRVLDTGCGTGNHAIEFIKMGVEVVGVDISQKMIERARLNAKTEQVSIQFEVAAFQDLTQKITGKFDTIVCIGNNLPLVLDEFGIRRSLQNMYQMLTDNGICIIQIQNYERILGKSQRFLPLKTAIQGDKEYLFFRMLDLHDDPLDFHIVTFERTNQEKWSYSIQSTKLKPWKKTQLEKFLIDAGFKSMEFYGAYSFEKYNEQISTDLIIVAHG